MKAWFGFLVVPMLVALAAGGCGGSSGTVEVVCGDGVQEGDEQCDDGNTDDGDDCDSECFVRSACGDDEVEGREECEPGIDEECHPVGHARECTFIRTAFRMDSLSLIDPTIKPNCHEGLQPIVNAGLQAATSEDESSSFATPQDGLIDLGFVFTFGTRNQGDGESSNAAFVLSDCDRLSKPSPVPNPSPCSPTITQDPSETVFIATTQFSGNCLEEIPDTTQDNTTVNPVEPGQFGCWVSPPFEFTVALGSVVQIPLSDVNIAAQWNADPAEKIVTGLIRGFLSEEDAENVVIDPDTFGIGGLSLKEVFGSDEGTGACDERDNNNGVTGYWVYLGFEAEAVPWEGGPMCGNGVVDTGGDGRDETCDTGIAAGQPGDCAPLLECDDNFACTEDTPNNGDSCAPKCFYRAFVDGDGGDNCCPALAPDGTDVVPVGAAQDDQDCLDLCEDDTLQAFEACDTSAGTACDDLDVLCADDGDACTVETGLQVIGTTRTVENLCFSCPEGACECKRTTIRQPDDGTDGCCPQRCINFPSSNGCDVDTNCPPDA